MREVGDSHTGGYTGDINSLEIRLEALRQSVEGLGESISQLVRHRTRRLVTATISMGLVLLVAIVGSLLWYRAEVRELDAVVQAGCERSEETRLIIAELLDDLDINPANEELAEEGAHKLREDPCPEPD